MLNEKLHSFVILHKLSINVIDFPDAATCSHIGKRSAKSRRW